MVTWYRIREQAPTNIFEAEAPVHCMVHVGTAGFPPPPSLPHTSNHTTVELRRSVGQESIQHFPHNPAKTAKWERGSRLIMNKMWLSHWKNHVKSPYRYIHNNTLLSFHASRQGWTQNSLQSAGVTWNYQIPDIQISMHETNLLEFFPFTMRRKVSSGTF